MRYKDAGVDIDRAEIFKKRIKFVIRKTFSKNVLTDIGLFSGLYSIPRKGYSRPVLVSSIDGVGTKTIIAELMNRHEVIGYDIVSHGANDILAQGARPLFFLDYIGARELDNSISIQLIKGMTKACRELNCSLIGGETAQMPDVYAKTGYEVAGAIIGIAERSRIINGSKVRPGDAVIGLESSGLHTNGYTLARNILLKKYNVNNYIPSLKMSIGRALLKPHKNYCKDVFSVMDKISIKGIAHITGGGLVDNIPRILPEGCGVQLDQKLWKILPVFRLIQKLGRVPGNDMYRTFNMGIGMILIVDNKDRDSALRRVKRSHFIGQVVKGKGVKINGQD